MRNFQLLIILLLFPLAFFTEQFENITIKLIILFFSIILLPLFFQAFIQDLKKRFIPTLAFLGFLIIATLTTAHSIDIRQSVLQLMLFYSFFIYFVSSRLIFPALKDKEKFIFYFLILISILSIISLYNILINNYVNKYTLSLYWVYYGHNHLSALLIFAIPLTLYFLKRYWREKRQRFFSVAVLALLVASLLFTFSIGAMISLAVSFLIVFIIFRKIIPSPLKKIYLTTFVIVALLGISSLWLFSEKNRIETLKFTKNPIKHLRSRIIYWQIGYENFLKNPLKGSGLNTFHIVFKKSDKQAETRYTTNTHNFFIQMLTEGGIFVFLSSIILIISILWVAAKNAFVSRNFLYIALFSGLLSSTLFSLVDLDWHVALIFLFFWIFASISTNYVKRKNDL